LIVRDRTDWPVNSDGKPKLLRQVAESGNLKSVTLSHRLFEIARNRSELALERGLRLWTVILQIEVFDA
jgi:hypothetical protein